MIDTVVVGAGASGLACAHALMREGVDVRCLEAAERPGGVIGTLEREGFRFELGPNTLQGGSESFRRICGELGIAGRLIVSRPEAKRRYIWHAGELRLLPGGPQALLGTKLLSRRAKLRLASEPLRKHSPVPASEPEPTFEAFLQERIGNEPTALFAGAFVRGVYAAEIDQLGARSAFPRLWNAANEHGGIVRGMRARAKARRQRRSPTRARNRRHGPVVFSRWLARADRRSGRWAR